MLSNDEVARRLKAARWLLGHTETGGTKPTVRTMPVAALAKHPELVANRISANRLEEAEQLVASLRPLELDVIARAMGITPQFFRDARPAPFNSPVAGAQHPSPPGELGRDAQDSSTTDGDQQRDESPEEPGDQRDTG